MTLPIINLCLQLGILLCLIVSTRQTIKRYNSCIQNCTELCRLNRERIEAVESRLFKIEYEHLKNVQHQIDQSTMLCADNIGALYRTMENGIASANKRIDTLEGAQQNKVKK